MAASRGGGRLKRLLSPANLAAVLGIFAINVALNVPLFEPGETRYRDSIEGGYASMARFYSQHPNPWAWNPLQYGGLPAQFVYLPGVPYLSGAISHLMPNATPDYVYRLATSTLACLIPSTFFLFVVFATGSRGWAAAAALTYTVFSPVYGLVKVIDQDRGVVLLPWHLQVLVKYGEGPQNAGLALMPLALAAAWRAGAGRGFGRVFLAAILLAAVALTNWVAALATAFCVLMLLLSLAGAPEFRVRRVLGAGLLGYGLACFWLTPSFVRTIALNWPADAFNYSVRQQQGSRLLLLAAWLAAIRLLFRWLWPGRRYMCFTALCFFGFAWCVVWFYSYGLNVIPEARRYALEFELFLFAALFEFFRLMWSSRNPSYRFAAIFPACFLLVAGLPQAWRFLTQDFSNRRPFPKEQSIEYRLARRLEELHPQGRIHASGGLRFRLNSWFDLAQTGGGFESGLTSRQVLSLAHCVRTAQCGDPLDALRALGVEYLVVHGPKSREHYRDFRDSSSYDGRLEEVHREEDDAIYRVPFSSLAHLVKPEEKDLRSYVASFGDAARPRLSAAWRGTSALDVEGAVEDGMLVSVQVRAEDGWSANQDGRPLSVESDAFGWILLKPTPSAATRISLQYGGTAEQRAMAGLSVILWLGALAWWMTRRRRGEEGVDDPGLEGAR